MKAMTIKIQTRIQTRMKAVMKKRKKKMKTGSKIWIKKTLLMRLRKPRRTGRQGEVDEVDI
jgi:hypothetical protein